MTSSSPEAPAREPGPTRLASGHTAQVRPLALEERELRAGAWTRLGDRTVLGDPVTEHMLSGLAEQAQAAARTQGYATGWAEGRRAADERAEDLRRELLAEHHAAEQRRDAEHRSAVEALLRAAAALTTAVTSVCDEVARHTVDVAAALTEELLGHELTTATAPGADAVRRALALLPEDAVVRVRLSPAETADPSLAERLGAVQVIADPSLERGDALVELVDGVLDARVSGAMARVREVLAS